MLEHIVINEKKYIPSTALAGDFGYTSDYIGKLAREEKILGIQIDRQWFIEPESLRTYLHKIKVEKEIKNEALRLIRKKERLTHEQKFAQAHQKTRTSAVTHALAAGVVMVCAVFSASLGSLSLQSGLDAEALVYGAVDAGTYIARTLDPSRVYKGSTFENELSRGDGETLSPEGTDLEDISSAHDSDIPVLYTKLPVVEMHEQPDTSSGESVGDSSDAVIFSEDVFSDEIKLMRDAHGAVYVVPHLREGKEGRMFTLDANESAAQNP